VNDQRSTKGADLSAFTREVLSIVSRIPVGRVATYGDIAAAAGRPRASRAVGNIMRASARPGLPYHRVIAAAGRLGGFGGNLALKRALLVGEGIVVSGTRVKDWQARAWRPAVRTRHTDAGAGAARGAATPRAAPRRAK
jgi:O-6-methylguanine DNA methyltransferase